MAFTKRSLLPLLGLAIWGDLGELTLYRARDRKLVVYPKQYPKDRESYWRNQQRLAFAAAAFTWRSLPEWRREEWRLAAKRASLVMTGYNLWMAHALRPCLRAIRTLEHQTNTYLLPPSPLPSSSSSSSSP